MQKSVLTLLFLFAAVVGGWFYLEKIHFFEKKLCIANNGKWNQTTNNCTMLGDETKCRKESGVWIDEENICDFGDVITP